MSQAGTLDMDEMYSILEQEKPNQREQIKIRADTLADYFPKDFTPRQKVELIESLVKEWHEKQVKQEGRPKLSAHPSEWDDSYRLGVLRGRSPLSR